MAPASPRDAIPSGQRSQDKQLNTALEPRDQLRSQPPRFLQRLVHEVRSPAHAIHISLSILIDSLRDADLPSDAEEALKMLSGSSDELRCSLRSLSRYAHTLDEIQPISLDIGKRIDAVWKKLVDSKQESAPLLRNSVKDVSLIGDDRLFDLAVECILDNSLKFASPDRPLEISVSQEIAGNSVNLRFQDNGIGIEEAYLPKCYEPFERLFPRTVYPGAGLGIPTAIACLTHMDGEVVLSALPEGALASLRFST